MRREALRPALLGDRVPVAAPEKTRSKQRLYRRSDVELLLKIRHLLYDERFTIEGARARLRELGHDEARRRRLRPPPEVRPRCYERSSKGSQDLIRIWSKSNRLHSTHRGVAQPG